MAGHPGYYSLIQYCPDLSRAESANVGVLLFCPALRFIDAKTAEGNDRVRKLFGTKGSELDRINAFKRSIETRVRLEAGRFHDLPALVSFIDTRANEIVLTPPRPIKVLEGRPDLDRLFDELVGGRPRPAHGATEPIPELEALLQAPSLAGRIWSGELVKVPVLGTTLRADYAYRNGAVNLIKPKRFSEDESGAKRAAAQLALEGDLLRKHAAELDEEYRLIVVSAGQPAAGRSRSEQAIAPLFAEYGVPFFPRSEVPQLVERIESEAH